MSTTSSPPTGDEAPTAPAGGRKFRAFLRNPIVSLIIFATVFGLGYRFLGTSRRKSDPGRRKQLMSSPYEALTADKKEQLAALQKEIDGEEKAFLITRAHLSEAEATALLIPSKPDQPPSKEALRSLEQAFRAMLERRLGPAQAAEFLQLRARNRQRVLALVTRSPAR
jgi:hypothetical protein